MNKQAIIKKIVAQLVKELAIYVKASHAARAEATHEQSKPENKYDTRGLEASYLARGQSRQAAEIEQAIEQFNALNARKFTGKDPIDIGALVELQTKEEQLYYFIGPRAGGTEVSHGGKEILVITPQSPLGQQLFGKKQGDRLQITIAGAKNEYRVVSVL
ncbi:MAG: GreA/GreB family elongation factor [Verrucomicrobia bacterium]|nr:GreA/GreB family elongation factor [Verrucomicrobiota bacterium]